MVVFKALGVDGLSPFQRWRWPLPPDDDTPGEWVEVEGEPRLCHHGLHGFRKLHQAMREGQRIYEMEVTGRIVGDDTKVSATRARLLRLVQGFDPIGPIDKGLRLCE